MLDPSQYAQIPAYAGTVLAITLLGWGVGGMLGGVLAHYIGRKCTMMVAIIVYSLFTGLSAFAWNWTPSPCRAFSSASRSARNGQPARR